MSDGVSIPFIDLKTQQARIRADLDARMAKVLAHGRYIMGPEVAEMEERLAQACGAKACIAVSSGTEALLISLMALGVSAGDEVITTPFTFVSTAEVIALLGARPVFVDIQPDTCNIDPEAVEAAITERTRAIIPVSLYGQPADMDEINAIARRHGLAVIEDGAQSFGAEYKERRSCNLSMLGCTSFFPSKPLGCYGDGGAIFTSDEALAQACREIRVHGQSRRYVHDRVGVGGRMDTLQCAVVLAKLEIFGDETERRKAAGARYNALMDDLGIERVRQRDDRTSMFAQYTVMVDNREKVRAHLAEAGIPTAVHYPLPLHMQKAYRTGAGGSMPVSERLAERVLSLPMHPYLEMEQQDMIAGKLRDALMATG